MNRPFRLTLALPYGGAISTHDLTPAPHDPRTPAMRANDMARAYAAKHRVSIVEVEWAVTWPRSRQGEYHG